MQAQTDGRCQKCHGPGPTKQVTFIRNIGVIVMRFTSTLSGRLCRNCIDEAFTSMWLPTLFLGWWGVISFFVTLVAVPTGLVTYLGALSLPRPAHTQPNSLAPNAFAALGAVAPTQPKKPRSPLFMVAVLAVPIVLCCMPITGLFAWAGVSSHALQEVGGVCDGRGSASAAAYLPVPGLHPIAGFAQRGTDWRADYDLVPDAWKTSDADTTELALCVGEEQRTVLERCPYRVSGGTSIIERVAYTREARVVVARTGQALGSKTVEGSAPRECADAEAFRSAGSTSELAGGHTAAADFEPLLRPFATGQPSVQ